MSRYQTGELLGQGGIGEVYRAFDASLGRPVALKFLRREEPRQVERLLREARAQAKVEHELVCRVYEVGEEDGRHFIAMQLIDGERLDLAAGKMTLEQKVLVVRDVARAVHAAHRVGLVHRDLKPGNILVERRDEVIKPFVTDFGLVRDASEETLTRTGEMLGTPPYMAPEQARGQLALLDRRTDVWGLGAVLYELLCGRPPFTGSSAVEVLFKVMHEEPLPPRKLLPSVPRDLEVIALRCLEKERERRYDSAVALAEELQRWLDGESILARPPGLPRRLWGRARRNKLASSAMALGLVVSLALLGLLLESRATSARRAQVAQRFGQTVEHIESELQKAYLLPLHDTRPERQRVRAQMAELEAELRRQGPWAEAIGSAALGRGHLALGELEPAREKLLRASALGDQGEDTAYALGRTLGLLYQAALAKVESIPDAKVREERRAALQRELRDPAVRALQRAGGAASAGKQKYVEGLLAFYEGKNDDALVLARAAAAADPLLYEARVLEANAHVRRTVELERRGAFDQTDAENAAAIAALAAAVEVARSDPAVRRTECDRSALRMGWVGRTAKSDSPVEVHRAAVAACERVLVADPDSLQAKVIVARVHVQYGDWQRRHGEDPTAALGAASALLATITSQPKAPSDAFGLLGPANTMLAIWAHDHGGDWRTPLEAAAQGLQRAIELEPRAARHHSNRGLILLNRSKFEREEGQDPLPFLEQAVRAQEAAVALDPKNASFALNLGVFRSAQAGLEEEAGRDPSASVAKATAAFERALAQQQSGPPYEGLGMTQLHAARFAVRTGADPSAAIERARAALRKAVLLDPRNPTIHKHLSETERLVAEWLGAKGEPAAKALAAARRSVEEAMRLNSSDPEVRVELAEVERVAGRPARAKELLEGVLRETPRDHDAREAMARLSSPAAVTRR